MLVAPAVGHMGLRGACTSQLHDTSITYHTVRNNLKSSGGLTTFLAEVLTLSKWDIVLLAVYYCCYGRFPLAHFHSLRLEVDKGSF